MIKIIILFIYYIKISDAAKQLNLSDGNICSVLKGRIKSTNGYHFEYISKEVYYKEKDNEKR